MAPKDKKEEIPVVTKLETAPFDCRYPSTNQTRHCYDSYVDFQKCIKYKGAEYEPCQYFKKVYKSMCPKSWTEKWDTQLEEGVFPAKI